jgi:EAL domain-containing protein (putative c-di-GMP-specific phosphodiesterase class I)
MRSDALTRLDLKSDLRHALPAGELRLVYQPIVAVQDSRTVAVEALLRWDHPDRGPVSPAEFIPLAEESGAIVPIGRWVLREACRQGALWDGITVSVNVSPRQLQQPGFVRDVVGALEETGLTPDRLVLELTEGLLVTDLDAAEHTLRALKQLGVSIAIDDFGTGFASLTYLQRFPVDVVKIDKSFIDTVAGEGSDLLDGLLALTRSLRVAAVAEGVEGLAAHDALRRLGCSFAQGYHYARPLPAPELPDVSGLAAVRR